MRKVVGLVLAAALLSTVAFLAGRMLVRDVTTSRLSPDETMRAFLVESFTHCRNFDVRLEHKRRGAGPARVIFRSPDEGHPIGTERFIWSKDSKWLLLVGRHFCTREAPRLASGETLYLLYNVKTGEVRCNSHQQSEHASFTLGDLEQLSFEDPLQSKDAVAPGASQGTRASHQESRR